MKGVIIGDFMLDSETQAVGRSSSITKVISHDSWFIGFSLNYEQRFAFDESQCAICSAKSSALIPAGVELTFSRPQQYSSCYC